jgi:carboxyl-terminal processing protease
MKNPKEYYEKTNKWLMPLLSTVIVVLVFLLGYVFGRTGFTAAWEGGEFTYSFKGTLYPEEREINFNLFWQVWDMLEQNYVDKAIDEQDMFYGAIKGLVGGLKDPHTKFYTPEETESYEMLKAGKFEGIGIELGYLDNEIIIKEVFENSPASEGGLESGDIIRKVNEEDTYGLTVYDVAERIRGEGGTEVILEVYRSDGDAQLSFNITRAEVYVESIVWEKVDNDVAKIVIRRFTEDSYADFTLLWDKVILEIQAEDPKGIIIDMRGNGGGFLDGATYIAGEFLNQGDTVLFIQDREGERQVMKVNRKGVFQEIPIIILVDGGTASASEIFAGTLQYYERAMVIGLPTFGKGTAQDVYKPADWSGASIHIVTQKWLLPNKRWINEDDPIQPDIEVSISTEELKKGEDPQLDEAIRELRSNMD